MQLTYPIPPEFVVPLSAGLRFGANRSTTYPPHLHAGVDLAFGYPGTPVLAAAAGIVSAVNTITTLGGPGIVYVDHGDGWQTRYLHLEAYPPVKKGQRVQAGDSVGVIAALQSGPHLHFEVLKNGKRLNPEVVLKMASGGTLALAAITGLIYLAVRSVA